jgi:hypothetical protein
LSKKFAFNIGGESNLGNMQAEHFQAMVAQPGFKLKYLLSNAGKLVKRWTG